MLDIRRRQFITLLGTAAAWPLAARAQQREKLRRIGILMNLAADDPEAQRRMNAFVRGLQQLGWTDGRNVQIDCRGIGAGNHLSVAATAPVGSALRRKQLTLLG
jgi:putative ABC transport system substrate-binding protein